jgi:hypothetical protein
VVAILALLWNATGAVTIILAQAGRLPGLDAAEAAYYASQATWFVVVTDVALLAAIAGAAALWLRGRAAVWLFSLSLAAIVVTHAYDLAAGTSRVLVGQGELIATVVIAGIAVLELAYARAMRLPAPPRRDGTPAVPPHPAHSPR